MSTNDDGMGEIRMIAQTMLENIDRDLKEVDVRRSALLTQQKRVYRLLNTISPQTRKVIEKTEKCEVCGEMFTKQGITKHAQSHAPVQTVTQ